MYTVVTFIVIVKISSLWSGDQSPVIFISSHDFSFNDFNLFLILRTVLITLFMLRLCYIMYYKDFGHYFTAPGYLLNLYSTIGINK